MGVLSFRFLWKCSSLLVFVKHAYGFPINGIPMPFLMERRAGNFYFTTAERWGYSFLAVTVISLVSFALAFLLLLIPAQSKLMRYSSSFTLSLGAGVLVGDAILHLIPAYFNVDHDSSTSSLSQSIKAILPQRFLPMHDMHILETEDSHAFLWKGVVVCSAIFLLYLVEKLLHTFTDHSHAGHTMHMHAHNDASSHTAAHGEVHVHRLSQKGREIMNVYAPGEPDRCSIGSASTNCVCDGEVEHTASSPDCKQQVCCHDSNEKHSIYDNKESPKENEVIDMTMAVDGDDSDHPRILTHRTGVRHMECRENHENSDLNISSDKESSLESASDAVSHHHHHHHHPKPKKKPMGWLIIFGDSLHNFIDGLAIAASFSSPYRLGLSTSLAVFLHEIPHELADFAILRASGFRRSRIVYFSLASTLFAYLGLVVGLLTLTTTNEQSWVFAVTAGTFLYISLTNVIPELVHSNTEWRFILLESAGILLGIGVMIILALFVENIQL